MLSKLIKNVRAKPESVRKSITLGVSLGVTGVVGFFWLISFLNYSSEVLLAKPKTESPTSFLNKMGSLIGESYANVRSKINEDGSFIETIKTTNSIEGDSSSVPETVVQDSNDQNSSVDLQDILNTKKQVNQENKATTSSEVLVQ